MHTLIPYYEDCPTLGAATSFKKKKKNDFFLTGGPFLNDQMSFSCLYLAMPALFGSESISQMSLVVELQGWTPVIHPSSPSLPPFPPLPPSLVLPSMYLKTVFFACSMCQTRAVTPKTPGLS